MSRFGIQDYEPHWLNGVDSITAVHGERLARLAGRTLRHVWVVWDLNADEWFSDAPVLLDFGDELVSIDHQKSDDLCITWNAIDPTRAIEDDGWDHDSLFDLIWRPEPTPQLAELVGRTLDHVELLERLGSDMTTLTLAIGCDFTATWLEIVNVGDENGFSFGFPDARYRRHRLNS